MHGRDTTEVRVTDTDSRPVECGNGLAANGGPIPVPCGGAAYVDWDRPSREIMRTMVENPEFYMRGLSPRDRERMAGDLMDMAEQLGQGRQMQERLQKLERGGELRLKR